VSSNLPIDCLLAGVVNDRGKTYGIYAVSVARHYETGYSEKWHVYRRYSDFHDLHQKVKDKVSLIVRCSVILMIPSSLSIPLLDLTVLLQVLKTRNKTFLEVFLCVNMFHLSLIFLLWECNHNLFIHSVLSGFLYQDKYNPMPMLHDMKDVQLHALIWALNGMHNGIAPVLPPGRLVNHKSLPGSGGKEKDSSLAGNVDHNKP
jgi:hypothetical protein